MLLLVNVDVKAFFFMAKFISYFPATLLNIDSSCAVFLCVWK